MSLSSWRTAVESDWRVLEAAPKELRSEREVILKAVGQAGNCLSYASEELRLDPEIALAALSSDPSSLEFVGNELWEDDAFVLKACGANLALLERVELSPCRERRIMQQALRMNWNALQYASLELRQDPELCLEAVQQHWRALIHVDESLWCDRAFMLNAIRCRWQCAQFLASELRSDGELYLEAIRRDVAALDFVDNAQRGNAAFMLEALKLQDVSLKRLTPALYEDPAFWLSVVKEIPHGWRLAYEQGPVSLRDNVEVMLEAVKRNVDVLEYGTARVRADASIMQEAVKHSWRAVTHASAKVDVSSILKAVEQDWRAISIYLDQLHGVEEIEDVQKLVKANPEIVRDDRLKGEKMVVLLAVKQDGNVLRFCTEQLRDDEVVAYAAVTQTWRALEFVSQRLKGDEDLVDLAFKQEGLALQHAAPELRAEPQCRCIPLRRSTSPHGHGLLATPEPSLPHGLASMDALRPLAGGDRLPAKQAEPRLLSGQKRCCGWEAASWDASTSALSSWFLISDPWFLWRPVATPCLFLSVMAEETMPHVMPALLSGTQLSHLQAQETLGTAQLREAVKCPPSVDEETWIASQMKEIFLEVVRMVHFLTSFCDDTTCPRMCAGDAEYKWAEVDGSVSWMPAARYMSRLIEDVDQRLIDESLIPTDGSPMPRHLRPELETMLRRLFRVYAHAYIHHFRTIQDCGAEAHVNCSFKHFLFFVLEFQLVRMDEMLPLEGLIRKFAGDMLP
eukprot:s1628_g1.t2